MKLKSLTKQGFLYSLKLASIYSLIIFLTISVLGFYQFKIDLINEVESEISSIANSFSRSTITNNYSLLIKEIQGRTNLQEILIFGKDCTLLASTTLNVINICNQGSKFTGRDLTINNTRVKIYFQPGDSFLLFLKKNSYKLVILAFIFFCITSILLTHFMSSCFIKPITKLRSSLRESNFEAPKELDFFTTYILELRKEIEVSDRERLYTKVARQVLHDIRNPLIYLKQIPVSSDAKNKIQEKVEEIEFHISSLVKSKKPQHNRLNLDSILLELREDVKTIFSLPLNLRDSNIILSSYLHPIELRNILLNMCQNSAEANATTLHLVCFYKDGFLNLELTDNGTGIEENDTENIFKGNFTSKEYGNGIGLVSIKHKLRSIGGDLSLQSSTTQGTSFSIKFPAQNLSQKVVVIDDDKFMHAMWIKKAEETGLEVFSYYSVDEFLKNPPSDFQMSIYVDSDLGEDEPGEVSSKKIADLGFLNIYLATNYQDIELKNYPWISDQLGKFGPLS